MSKTVPQKLEAFLFELSKELQINLENLMERVQIYELSPNTLQVLDLSDLGLTEVPDTINNDEISISLLVLKKNKIIGLKDDIFSSSKIKFIDLGSNELDPDYLLNHRFPDFKGKGIFLKNNSIEELNANFFDSVPNLELLDLSHNILKHIPDACRSLMNLISLDLNSNLIYQIVKEDLTFPKLYSLNVHNNKINSLPNNVFDHSIGLLELNLEGNPLKTLPSSFLNLQNLKTINTMRTELEKEYQLELNYSGRNNWIKSDEYLRIKSYINMKNDMIIKNIE